MIIGIAGRMGSGKDTVGSIIQYLLDRNVVNESFDFWYSSNFYSVYQFSKQWEIKKFAGKLKEVASLITGVPVEMWEDQDFKQGRMPYGWGMTYREFLQKLGTEAMRDGLHKDVWVNALFADYKYYEKYNHAFSKDGVNYGNRTLHYPDWLITDMRFPNEMDAVKERDGITIRVSRTGIHTPKIEDLHPSETALDDCEFDYHIDNSGTIEDLIEKVREMLVNEKLL